MPGTRRNRYLSFAAVCALMLVSAIGMIILVMQFTPEPSPQFKPDRVRYPLRGIDVSHHQGVIDWPAVSRDDTLFAFIKATEGGDHRDTRFAINWVEARAAGLKVGAYHYFTLCRPGIEQARNFIAVVPKEEDALPPALDLEFPGNCPARPEPDQLRLEVEAFLNELEPHFGRQAILYVEGVFESVYGSVLPVRVQWYPSHLVVPSHENWAFWQYSPEGQVTGISTPVDLNVFRADHAQFNAFFQGSVQLGP